MTRIVPVDLESIEIGRRARRIRRRRGLSLEVVAGLAGFTKSYLSMLENGQRGFNRRGLIEDLAGALGCSVTDLTGQPYLPVDRDTADALTGLQSIRVALHDYRPDDVPDVRPRPVDELVALAQTADGHVDQTRFSLAGRELGTLITELQAHALTVRSATPGVHRADHGVHSGDPRHQEHRQHRPGGHRGHPWLRPGPPPRRSWPVGVRLPTSLVFSM
ncbi:MAG: helix-turn-helix domain-containing protein [Pseudonocardiaceae bacterium]